MLFAVKKVNCSTKGLWIFPRKCRLAVSFDLGKTTSLFGRRRECQVFANADTRPAASRWLAHCVRFCFCVTVCYVFRPAAIHSHSNKTGHSISLKLAFPFSFLTHWSHFHKGFPPTSWHFECGIILLPATLTNGGMILFSRLLKRFVFSVKFTFVYPSSPPTAKLFSLFSNIVFFLSCALNKMWFLIFCHI